VARAVTLQQMRDSSLPEHRDLGVEGAQSAPPRCWTVLLEHDHLPQTELPETAANIKLAGGANIAESWHV